MGRGAHEYELDAVAGRAQHRSHVSDPDVVRPGQVGFGLGIGRLELRGADRVAILGEGNLLLVCVAHGVTLREACRAVDLVRQRPLSTTTA